MFTYRRFPFLVFFLLGGSLFGQRVTAAPPRPPAPFVFILNTGEAYGGPPYWGGDFVYISPCDQLSGSSNQAVDPITFFASKSAGLNSATGTLRVTVDKIGYHVFSQDGGLYVYALGPPGTSYHLDFTSTGRAISTLTTAPDADYMSRTSSVLGVYSQQIGSVGTTTKSLTVRESVDGVTSTPTLTCLGQNYSYATARSLANVAADMEPNLYNNPPAGISDATGTIGVKGYLVRANQTPPTAVIDPIGQVTVGDPVKLNGSNSFDTDGDSIIQYQWTIQNSKGGSDSRLGASVQYTWGDTGPHLVVLHVTDSDGQTGMTEQTVNAVGCGDNDERDKIIEEYPKYGVNWIPTCDDFTTSARSVDFGPHALKSPDFLHYLARQPLIAPKEQQPPRGIDAFVAFYGAPRTITSAYRSPAHNAKVGGKPNSRHVYGDAADFLNKTGSQSEWDDMVVAARSAKADGIGQVTFPDALCAISCVHTDWRDHSGGYVQSSGVVTKVENEAARVDDQVKHHPLTVSERLALVENLRAQNAFVLRHRILTEAYFSDYSELIDQVASLQDPMAMDALLGCMTTGETATRGIAHLGEIAIFPVIKKLSDQDINVRQSAAAVLSDMLDPELRQSLRPTSIERIKQALVEAVSDGNPYVRISAIQGLANIGGADVRALLETLALQDPYDASAHGGDKDNYPVRNAASLLLSASRDAKP